MSLLIERFAAAKDGLGNSVAEEEIINCVRALRRRIGAHAVAPGSLEPFLASRRITDVAIDEELKADGALVPLGKDFGAGFRMVLRRDLPERRINFTVAHEICHTFFYERAPEIKFAPHPVDEEEERLCNCGAEEILMPALDVKRRARSGPVSLEVLQTMAAHYRVSPSAMLIRLRRLRLWRAELFLWHQMTNGSFAVKRAWGAKLTEWQWTESEIPRRALSSPSESVISGSTDWFFESPRCRKSKALTYDAKRYGHDVLVLVILKHKKSSAHEAQQQRELFVPPSGRRNR